MKYLLHFLSFTDISFIATKMFHVKHFCSNNYFHLINFANLLSGRHIGLFLALYGEINTLSFDLPLELI